MYCIVQSDCGTSSNFRIIYQWYLSFYSSSFGTVSAYQLLPIRVTEHQSWCIGYFLSEQNFNLCYLFYLCFFHSIDCLTPRIFFTLLKSFECQQNRDEELSQYFSAWAQSNGLEKTKKRKVFWHPLRIFGYCPRFRPILIILHAQVD